MCGETCVFFVYVFTTNVGSLSFDLRLSVTTYIRCLPFPSIRYYFPPFFNVSSGT